MESQKRKKVLIITYYWPPAGGPGVQRVLKFVKYLPEFGWEPVVLTVANGEYPAIDESLEKEISTEHKIYKLKSLEPFSLYKKLFNKKQESISAFELVKKDGKFSTKVSHFIRNNLFIPDARIGFFLKNKKTIKEMVQNEIPDAVFISSPPPSFLLIGKYLKDKLGVKWIADFRDPWTDAFWEKNNNRLSIIQKAVINLEKKMIENADLISCVSPAITKSFADKVQSPHKVSTIYNGYDSDDFDNSEQQVSEKFRMSFIGGLGASQICENFFIALGKLSNSLKETIEIKFIGHIDKEISNLIILNQLSSFVSIESYKPHHYVVERIKNSELLLLFIAKNSGEGVISGKFFEYLATNNEIMAVTEGANQNLEELLISCDAGQLMHYSDNFENYISQKLHSWQNGKTHKSNLDAIKNYSRKNQTEQLALLLDKLKQEQ